MAQTHIDALYQRLILDHYRNPRNKAALARHSVEASRCNPVCGDEVTVQLVVEEGRIARAAFTGHGCSISQAAASMMTDVVRGLDAAEALRMAERFQAMMTAPGLPAPGPEDPLGDLRALQGVSRFPVRVPCAMLAFEALRDALAGVGGTPCPPVH
ncbi:MAG: SUF system NifU family Fe-S cluster assembly protein [Gemmatimonadetes bacterium]|nr:MAG: SUF system NifU family Fe-S cluster assembly protein [Gemmatimonadota bacterium]